MSIKYILLKYTKSCMSKQKPSKEDIQMAINLFSNGQLGDALDACDDLLNKYPNEAIIHNISGACYGGIGRQDEAIKSYENALKINPNYAQAHNNLGNIYKEQGNLNEAFKSYNFALSIEPL